MKILYTFIGLLEIRLCKRSGRGERKKRGKKGDKRKGCDGAYCPLVSLQIEDFPKGGRRREKEKRRKTASGKDRVSSLFNFPS